MCVLATCNGIVRCPEGLWLLACQLCAPGGLTLFGAVVQKGISASLQASSWADRSDAAVWWDAALCEQDLFKP